MQSLLDDVGLADVSNAAKDVEMAVEQQQFEKATELWSVAETVVEQVSATEGGVTLKDVTPWKKDTLMFEYKENCKIL